MCRVDADELEDINAAMNNPNVIDNLVEMGQGVFDILASKRAYEAELLGWYASRAHPNGVDEAKHALLMGVSTEDFLKSYRSRLQKLVGIKEGSGFKIHGQFRESIPRKWYVASRVADRIVTK
jgi:hypothetical protein